MLPFQLFYLTYAVCVGTGYRLGMTAAFHFFVWKTWNIFFLTELTKSIFGESVFTHDKITAAPFELRQISVLLGCNLWTHLSVVYLSFLSFKRSFFYIYSEQDLVRWISVQSVQKHLKHFSELQIIFLGGREAKAFGIAQTAMSIFQRISVNFASNFEHLQ